MALTGTSMGGFVILIYASKHHDRNIRALVPICPPFKMDETAMMRNKEVMKKWKENGYTSFYVRTKGSKREKKTLSYGFVDDSLRYNMSKTTKKIDVPVLLIHGNRDMSVPLERSKLYYKNLAAHKKLVILRGAGHNHEFRKKDTKIVYREMSIWLKRYLKN